MSARDGLIELIESGVHHAFSVEEAVEIALQEHAHELAEQIRANIAKDWEGMSEFSHGFKSGQLRAADVIDPEVDHKRTG